MNRPATPTQRGFTLLELLVVMSLLSVIMVGLMSAMRTMAQTESKIDQRLQRLDEIRVARNFLQQTLNRVSAVTIDSPGTTGKRIIPFKATLDTLTWVGIMPARADIGGRYFFRLAMEDTPGGRELVLRFSPWKPDIMLTDWRNTEARILIKDIKQITIQAQGLSPEGRGSAKEWPKGWQNGWPVTDSLPEKLTFHIIDTHGNWPDWTIGLNAMPQNDDSFNIIVFGRS